MTKLIDHLKIRNGIDPATGKIWFVYFYKRKQCPVRPIPGPLAKQYVGYYLIKRDLEEAESWLELAYESIPEQKKRHSKAGEDNYIMKFIGDEKNHRIIKSLFFSSVVFYGKCFTQAKGRGIKLERSIVPDSFRDKHDKIMDYRHTLAAHSGEGRWERGEVKLILPPKRGSNVGIHIRPELNRLDFEDDREDKCTFFELIRQVKSVVVEKSEKVGQKIINEIVIPKGEDYWYGPTKKKG